MDHLFVKANYLILLYFTTSMLPSMTYAADHFEIEGCAQTKTRSITKTGHLEPMMLSLVCPDPLFDNYAADRTHRNQLRALLT